ncbi:AMP-binding protein [Pseudonocardia sp. KRD291]|uniref:AMP-binding protein n=1 Tax=Pseudonocardia sp. KRD291 TaxID=2792007 RepID=UPI001C49E5F1|nr:AMP-binding protein [Pseudonocardia sp. KRD291]MBW0103183.1 AMP-binding protein [Pseudonocardia sp. KRD291]
MTGTYDAELATNLIQRACVGDVLTRTTARFPHRTAVVDGDVVLTYRALNDAVNQVARSLLASGLQRGDVVGVVSRNHWVIPVTYLAAAKAGLVYLPLNVALTTDEMCFMLHEAEAAVLVAEEAFSDHTRALLEALPAVRALYVVDDGPPHDTQPVGGTTERVAPFAGLMTGPTAEVEVLVENADTLQLLYTSGTTDRPKGVATSHLAVLISGLSTALAMQLEHIDVTLSVMPLFHTGQLNAMWLPHLFVGACTVISRSYDPDAALDAVADHGITTTLMTGPMWVGLLDQPGIGDRDLSTVRLCVIGAASLSPERVAVLASRFPNAQCRLISGQTEFTPVNEIQRPEHAHTKTTSWGAPAVTMGIAAMDEEGRLLPPGELGELVYRGPQAMTGYLKNPEATADVFRHGWFHTGDLGWVDEENVVWFVDRRKDIIKTGGENVASLEVELAVAGHPAVAECAVVGLPHERWTEAVTAFVRCSAGAAVSTGEIVTHCRDRLAGFKVPKAVILLDELPRSSSGKIQKFHLRAEYAELYAGEAGVVAPSAPVTTP